ncbi:ATP-binding protein [Leptolyngbya sp. PCC 6406]|uniref:ATP-binding protein n=1 Tax=Leptolyngbya sp. PCC 6406 TaxID=1173264 RepID=UPI0002AC1681|nr:ATP-binding protein [Leptolyngbya sp. PCC 6406]
MPSERSVQVNWQQANLSYVLGCLTLIQNLLDRLIATIHERYDDVPETATVDLAAISAQMPTHPALTQLGQQFQLSTFELNILLLCVGRVVHPDFPNLFALAHRNLEQNYPTFQLALKLFADSDWQALTPSAPLRRWQLVQLAQGEDIAQARLQIDESILHYLLGEPYDDAVLREAIEPFSITPAIDRALTPSHQTIADQMVALLRHRKYPAQVQLCGSEVEQKWSIIATVSTQLNQPVYVLTNRAIPHEISDIKRFIMRWQRWVALSPSLLLIDADQQMDHVEGSPLSLLDFLLRTLNSPIILSTTERRYVPQCALVSFDVARLSYRERLTLWESALGDNTAKLNGQLHRIVSQFNLPPATIEAAGVSIQQLDTEDPQGDNPFTEKLWQFCRTQARPQLDNLAQRIDTTATWDDLVLPHREKGILQMIATQVQQRAKVYEEWGFSRKSQRGLGISVLFSGQSGTGKTMAAEVLAKQFRLDLYRIDLSTVVSKYIGETEKNLRRIFDAAETGGAVLLFDEADALFGKRTEVKDSHDRHANVEVSYLLQRMESYQGLAILTTNLKKSLDQAFMRRIRFITDFPFPDREARTEIWRRIFPSQTPIQGLKYDKLGNLSVAGGNIRTIALNAAFLAAAAEEPVQMGHILQAAQQEYIKLDLTLTSTEVAGWVAREKS